MIPVALLALAPLVALAQISGGQNNKPIEISADKLDVLQNDQKAIFSGNVIAVQGTTTMRAAQMTVFYRDAATAAKPAADAGAAKGIYRIESTGNVVFTTPSETAIGDKAIYNVDTDAIDLTGANVTLTQGQNILKGTALNHNMTTGRSILTGGAVAGKPARVHGLFVPKSDSKPAGKP